MKTRESFHERRTRKEVWEHLQEGRWCTRSRVEREIGTRRAEFTKAYPREGRLYRRLTASFRKKGAMTG